MIDRGIIKWQPFNSCFNANEIIQDISKKKAKEKVTFPTLSDDQLMNIENKIKMAFQLKTMISIDYYYDNEIKNLRGKISYFDYTNKKIYLNGKEIYFSQIIKIKEN